METPVRGDKDHGCSGDDFGNRVVAVRVLVLAFAILWAGLLVFGNAVPLRAETDSGSCLECHEDSELVAEDGRPVAVLSETFSASIHGELECIDCHSTPGDYEDIPHYVHYVPVDCGECHDEAVESFRVSFHGRAYARGNPRAPDCAACHGIDSDPHRMHGLGTTTAEGACRRCHDKETASYDSGVHAKAAQECKPCPGCISCHRTHGPGLPPSAGAVNALCETCHKGAMEDVGRGEHLVLGEDLVEVLNCASCHDVHGTHKPHLSPKVAQACINCHADEMHAFAGSVHEDLFQTGKMNCISCHSTHKEEEETELFDTGCGTCHKDVEETYRGSVHRLGRLRGGRGAATCADCHEGHKICAVDDPVCSVHPDNVPTLCGSCHGNSSVITSDYVRLPITLPNYITSVHGEGWREGKNTAVCTDCHGTHDLQTAQDPASSINRFRLPETCGRCHPEVSREFMGSVHSKAVALGIGDAPTCTSCHDEHLMQHVDKAGSRVSPEEQAAGVCGDCHTDPELHAKYGITAGVVESYLDSYHGWAMKTGGELVATCTDCHNTHDVRSPLDPASSVHQDNVTATCGRCHEGSNPTFAQSYSHESALQARGAHGWVRLIYIILVAGVLGGMFIHNLVIVRFELLKHFSRRKSEPDVVRWKKAERVQHLVLLLSFIGLAITGFALRFPDAWWVKLVGLGGREAVRAILHRALATVLVVDAIYHLGWMMLTRRGRWSLSEMKPAGGDFGLAFRNVAFHLGFRRERPAFRMFDYTQKAEYWAVVWGTAVMGITGFVLWFPTIATSWLPAWSVRVAEVIHFYEAILAVSAIIIWHFFYVIFMPSEYPMSTVWLTGRMPEKEWKETHRAAYLEQKNTTPEHPSNADSDEKPMDS